MTETIIDVRHLSTRFGAQIVHRDISFAVYRGEVLAIVGGSGSGKTTLLRQILGLERPASGEVRVFGESVTSAEAERRVQLRTRWGVLFQGGALFSALNVYDNVALPLRELKTLDEDLIRDLVCLKLGMVGIESEHCRKMPAELSGGMVKRVALARALALEPELLFLDEPTAGLDPDRAEGLVELVSSLRRDLHLTIVVVTHDLDTLLGLSDRVAVLYDQRLIAIGRVDDVVANEHPFIRAFFRSERGLRALENGHAAATARPAEGIGS